MRCIGAEANAMCWDESKWQWIKNVPRNIPYLNSIQRTESKFVENEFFFVKVQRVRKKAQKEGHKFETGLTDESRNFPSAR